MKYVIELDWFAGAVNVTSTKEVPPGFLSSL